MIKLTEFTSVVDTYKKNFALRSKRFDAKKKKDLAEEREEREKKIEAKKLFKLDNIKDKISDKAGNILDTVIRFAAFTLIGVLVKNIDKITIALKSIVEKLKEFAVNAKKFFEEKVVPFLKDIFNLGKDIFNVFVGIGDFVIGMNPFKDFDSEFNIILRGMLGLAGKLGELNAPKDPPGPTSQAGTQPPAKTPVKTPVKTPIKSLTRQPAKAAVNPISKTLNKSRSLVGAGVNEDVIKTDRGDIPKSNPLRTDLEKTIAREYKLPEIAKLADDPKISADVRAAANNILRQRLELQLARTSNIIVDDFKRSQRIRGPYSTIQPGINYTTSSLKKAAETGFFAPSLPKPKELSLYEKFLGKGRQVLGEVQKGKDALGNFTKSLQRSVQSKLGNSADALKRIGSTKIPGIGLLDKIPMGARRFVGRTLRLLSLYSLAKEVEQDFRNGDINAVIVKLSAYGLGWLVTSAGLIAGSALGISGVGTLAGVAVLGGSIGAGAGTEMLIRKLFLENESATPPKVKPKVPVVDDSLERLEFPEHFAPKPDQQIPETGNQSSTSKPSTVASVNRNISDGLNEPTTYGSQGIVKTRELFVAIQPIEKQVLVPAA